MPRYRIFVGTLDQPASCGFIDTAGVAWYIDIFQFEMKALVRHLAVVFWLVARASRLKE